VAARAIFPRCRMSPMRPLAAIPFLAANVHFGWMQPARTATRETTMNDDRTIRAALARHGAASDANDFAAEHEIYRDAGEPGA
jgi:hypothetical protein